MIRDALIPAGSRLRQLFTIVGLTLISAPALAQELGTCLTEGGTWVSPWTDATDPACGEDCGAIADEAETLCSTADGTCGLDDQPVAQPTMPPPTGPRCLEPGPSCVPGGPFGGGLAATFIAHPIDSIDVPRRGQGTLPGAGPPFTVQRVAERSTGPSSPPPRV